MKDVFIVIPAFNEGPVIDGVIRNVRSVYDNVVVVDDGSSDATADIALAAGAYVLRHPFNMGQGAALQTGLDFAIRQNAPYIATFDADGQHDIQDVTRMLALLRQTGADVVLGSRFLGSAHQLPPLRRLVLRAAVAFTALTSGLKLTDTHNGLRLFTLASAKKIKLRQNKMAHASEILDQIAELRLKYAEAPVSIRYTDYSLAKGQKISGVFAILSDILYGKISK